MSAKPFLTDVQTLRRRVRQNIDHAALVCGYSPDRKEVLELLNDSLVTEVACARCHRHYHFQTAEIHANGIADDFVAPVNEDQDRAARTAGRRSSQGPTRRRSTNRHGFFLNFSREIAFWRDGPGKSGRDFASRGMRLTNR